MVYCSSHIEIGNYVFRSVNSVHIESDMFSLSDRATIKLPNLKGILDRKLAVGSYVKIMLGYDDDLHTEFTGYVDSISPKIPLEINCEDQMRNLKQAKVSKSWPSVKLHDVLKYLVPDVKIECQDIELTSFRIPNQGIECTKAQALDSLREDYGLCVYFRNGKLWAGLAYGETGLGEVNYHFQKNALMGDLVFRRSDDFKVKLTAISFQEDGSKITVEVGDSDGETRTLHYFNLSQADLKARAEDEIKLFKVDGYSGSFVGKGIPRPRHGMVVNLADNKYPERAGRYFIDKVVTDYNGSDGFKRQISLGRRASA